MPVALYRARIAIFFAAAAIGLEALAGELYWAAAGFPNGLNVDPLKILGSGSTGASLIRWGSMIDMFGYLCIAPVCLYLRERFRSAKIVDFYATAGLAVVVIGSIGAVAMATAAPPLINQYAAGDPTQKLALVPVFGTLYRVVVVGMWQTLETIPAAIWLLGTASAARREGPRSLLAILIILGVINGAIALFRLIAT
ncbi:MAG: hypothetical protein M3082_04280 [Candidatus Dormibacteraeota bacterium]|nr:hypothetical protein [Candidatus Dormibacteraeota bacterium]